MSDDYKASALPAEGDPLQDLAVVLSHLRSSITSLLPEDLELPEDPESWTPRQARFAKLMAAGEGIGDALDLVAEAIALGSTCRTTSPFPCRSPPTT